MNAAGVTAMTATTSAGLVYAMLGRMSESNVARFCRGGTVMLYVWGIGVWLFTQLIGDYTYGKFAPKGGEDFGHFGTARSLLGFPVPSRVAWCVQECPACIVPAICWATAPKALAPANRALLGMFIAHYFQRSFIYALRIRGSKGTPLSLMLSCFFFCTGNGLLQGLALTRHYTLPAAHLRSRIFAVGALVWAAGFAMNVRADDILLKLRKPGETGYKIPRGGMFEYISGANFVGEIVEWYGWALAGGQTLGTAWAFAVFTMFNIAPRACATHRWYLDRFKDYPQGRKRLLPFVY